MPGLVLSISLALLLPIDVFSAMAGLWGGNNSIRFITGGLWGFFGIASALGILVLLIERARKYPSSIE